MKRYGIAISFLFLSALALTGCASMGALSRADRIEREAKKDRLVFYERLSDAYFILGYEYFSLAKEAEARGEKSRFDDYCTRARLYNVFYRDMKKLAEEARQDMQPGDGLANSTPPTTGEPANTVPPTTMEQSQTTPVDNASQVPTVDVSAPSSPSSPEAIDTTLPGQPIGVPASEATPTTPVIAPGTPAPR
jgi:hypothetical protein